MVKQYYRGKPAKDNPTATMLCTSLLSRRNTAELTEIKLLDCTVSSNVSTAHQPAVMTLSTEIHFTGTAQPHDSVNEHTRPPL